MHNIISFCLNVRLLSFVTKKFPLLQHNMFQVNDTFPYTDPVSYTHLMEVMYGSPYRYISIDVYKRQGLDKGVVYLQRFMF